MGRIRSVKPELFVHEELFKAEHDTGLPLRLAFIGLFCACDREGRFKWRPNALKLSVLPYDDVDFSRVLDALTTRGFVVRYASGTREARVDYGCIPTFRKHQVVNNRESASDIPGPQEKQSEIHEVVDASSTREARVEHASSTRGARGLGGREGKGREGKEKRKDAADPKSANGNGKDAASPPDSRTLTFRSGIALLMEAGSTEVDARKFLGMLKRDHGEPRLLAALERAEREKPIDPKAWLVKAAQIDPRKPQADFLPEMPAGSDWS